MSSILKNMGKLIFTFKQILYNIKSELVSIIGSASANISNRILLEKIDYSIAHYFNTIDPVCNSIHKCSITTLMNMENIRVLKNYYSISCTEWKVKYEYHKAAAISCCKTLIYDLAIYMPPFVWLNNKL